MLRDLLVDPNPTVVSNAVAALSEIGDRNDGVTFKLNFHVANKLLTALGESSEYVSRAVLLDPLKLIFPTWRWGQIYILDSLLRFVPDDTKDAEILAERITIQMQHANSAVVLTTIKILLYLMNYMDNRKLIDHICKKMGPPLGQST